MLPSYYCVFCQWMYVNHQQQLTPSCQVQAVAPMCMAYHLSLWPAKIDGEKRAEQTRSIIRLVQTHTPAVACIFHQPLAYSFTRAVSSHPSPPLFDTSFIYTAAKHEITCPYLFLFFSSTHSLSLSLWHEFVVGESVPADHTL